MQATNVHGLSQRIAKRKQKDVQLQIAYYGSAFSLGVSVYLLHRMRLLEREVIAALK